MRLPLLPKRVVLRNYLRKAGYFCTNNAKNDYQFQPPVGAWDENGREAHWRNRPDPAMPFFSVFNFEVTHESRIHNHPSPEVTDPGSVEVPPYYPDTETVRRDIAHHYDNIAALDRQIGEVLRQLEEDGLMEETVIFFFGDHGDGLPRAKRWVYDSGIRVPLVVRFPGEQNLLGREGALVSFIDFAPTVLSLAGIEEPTHMQGQAFLEKEKAEDRSYIYAFRDRMDPAFETIRAVRDKRFKYVRNYRPELPYIGFIPYRDRMEMMREILQLATENKLGANQWQFYSRAKPLEELYDTRSDPHEVRNLAADPAHFETLERLRAAHENFQQKFPDSGCCPRKS